MSIVFEDSSRIGSAVFFQRDPAVRIRAAGSKDTSTSFRYETLGRVRYVGVAAVDVLHISTSDSQAGGFRAAHRLHRGLQHLGVTSRILVQFKTSDDTQVFAAHGDTPIARGIARLTAVLDHVPLQFYKTSDTAEFSPHWVPDSVPSRANSMHADVINLHWVSAGFLSIESVPKFDVPLVWTFHDMWGFTGGCHYSHGCEAYRTACGACPELGSRSRRDLSWLGLLRKARSWKNLDLTIVTPSSWLADCVRSSSLFRDTAVHVIANGLDVKRFSPLDRQLARRLLQLPQDKRLVLFGAQDVSDKRKGFDLLESALARLKQTDLASDLQLLVFGSSGVDRRSRTDFETHYLGRLHDELTLALVYSAADVMVVPSREEAFGQTASEALACGTPVVCFDSTGLRDVVDHLETGYRAKSFEVDDLAKGIVWILEDEERRQRIACRARQRAEETFAVEVQARAYLKVYGEALARPGRLSRQVTGGYR